MRWNRLVRTTDAKVLAPWGVPCDHQFKSYGVGVFGLGGVKHGLADVDRPFLQAEGPDRVPTDVRYMDAIHVKTGGRLWRRPVNINAELGCRQQCGGGPEG